ncbi:NUDIX hydrolase [Kineosporia sp. NBRC 101731]|uniref:NUDIX hydrolase n=1 Tax=Kineosporia sp. NBRC 101731 TaxID=3032199 RepID=UPI0024A51D66|nr:NUDIX hydrolase [Kineosporia sp. NBRC 101731]GLY29877.1 hypothetical protein Kisp02_32420 [Kineosporia sp. NBRC 101731]
MDHRNLQKSEVPEWTHGDWVQIYVDRDPQDHENGFARIVENWGIPGVAVIPIRGRSIGMVQLYRPPITRSMLEIPRGMGHSEDLRAEAVRELQEETGLKIAPDALIDLGAVFPNGGLLATQIRLFAAVVPDTEAPTTPEDVNEIDQFLWVPVEDLLGTIRESSNDPHCTRDAITDVALLRALLAGLLPAVGL